MHQGGANELPDAPCPGTRPVGSISQASRANDEKNRGGSSHHPGAGDQAADAGELGHVDETLSQPAAAGDAAAGFQQIPQADKLQQGNSRQHRQAADDAGQAEQPFQRQQRPPGDESASFWATPATRGRLRRRWRRVAGRSAVRAAETERHDVGSAGCRLRAIICRISGTFATTASAARPCSRRLARLGGMSGRWHIDWCRYLDRRNYACGPGKTDGVA